MLKAPFYSFPMNGKVFPLCLKKTAFNVVKMIIVHTSMNGKCGSVHARPVGGGTATE